jgi:phosphoglycolate phosphatase/putative hydrolase of the HAD superfamily
MKIFNLPKNIKFLIFDMDGTLYTNEPYLSSQFDCMTENFARFLGVGFGEAGRLIDDYRARYAAAHDGASISHSDVFLAFGVPVETSIQWREKYYQPERYLKPDPLLRAAMESLASRFALAVVTNNTSQIARRTFDLLGIPHLPVTGVDDYLLSKPDPLLYSRAAAKLRLPPACGVSVGDRYEFDLAPALSLGMGGILVSGAEDVYRLPEIL